MTPLSKELYDALHADGYHVVTRQEWYAQQARMAALERLYRAMHDLRVCESKFDECGDDDDTEGQSVLLAHLVKYDDAVDVAFTELEALEK